MEPARFGSNNGVWCFAAGTCRERCVIACVAFTDYELHVQWLLASLILLPKKSKPTSRACSNKAEEMSTQANRVLDFIGRLVEDPGTDADLVARFVRGDRDALASLVKRHGPMVLGLCRRMLSEQDAEDAFQATFLVLARRARSLSRKDLVGSWLYGVAYRVASRFESGRGLHSFRAMLRRARRRDP